MNQNRLNELSMLHINKDIAVIPSYTEYQTYYE